MLEGRGGQAREEGDERAAGIALRRQPPPTPEATIQPAAPPMPSTLPSPAWRCDTHTHAVLASRRCAPRQPCARTSCPSVPSPQSSSNPRPHASSRSSIADAARWREGSADPVPRNANSMPLHAAAAWLPASPPAGAAAAAAAAPRVAACTQAGACSSTPAHSGVAASSAAVARAAVGGDVGGTLPSCSLSARCAAAPAGWRCCSPCSRARNPAAACLLLPPACCC